MKELTAIANKYRTDKGTNMKITILLMSCKINNYHIQCNYIKQKLIELTNILNLSDNIKIYDYIGSHEKQMINNNSIYLTSDDTNTYEKTIECFEFIRKNIEFDYIVRTNGSTFINIELLYNFIKYINYNSINNIFSSDLLSLKNQYAPNEYDITMAGHLMIFNKFYIDTLLKYKYLYKTISGAGIYINNNVIYDNIDDLIISTNLHILYKDKYLDIIKSVGTGFYKCIDNIKIYEGNSLCKWNNTNKEFNFIKNFISFRLKSNSSESPNEIYNKVNDLFDVYQNNINTDNDNQIINILNYSKNPDVFVGWESNPCYKKLNNL